MAITTRATWIMDGKGGVVARIDETKRPPTEHLMVPDGDDWREVAKADVIATGGVNIAGLTDDGAGVVRGTLVDGRFALTRLDLATSRNRPPVGSALRRGRSIVDEWTGRVIGGVCRPAATRRNISIPSTSAGTRRCSKAFRTLSCSAFPPTSRATAGSW